MSGGRRALHLVAAFVAAASSFTVGAFAAVDTRAQDDDAPAPLPAFVRIERPVAADEVARLQRVGISGFAVRAGDAAALASVAAAAPGAPLLLEDAITAPGLALDAAWYAEVFAAHVRERDPALLARRSCPNRPAVRARLLAEAQLLAERLRGGGPGPNPVFAVSLARDPGLARGSDPFDHCRCSSCLAAGAWWTIDQARAFNEGRTADEIDLGPWLDHGRFEDGAFAALLDDLVRAAGDVVPVGFAGGAAPNPFSALEWSRVARTVPLLAPPDDPVTRDLVRSVAPPGTLVLSELRSYGGRTRIARQALCRHVLLGARAVLFDGLDEWLAEEPALLPEGARAADGKVPPPLEHVASLLRDLRERVVPALDGARLEDGPAAILFSPASMRVRWFGATELDGLHWPYRTHDRLREVLNTVHVWVGWMRLLDDVGLGYRFLPESELERVPDAPDAPSDEDPLAGVRVLVLPGADVLSDRAAARIAEFAARGGVVLASGAIGVFDERGRARAAEPLLEAAGIVRLEAPIGRYWIDRLTDRAAAGETRDGLAIELARRDVRPVTRVLDAAGEPAPFVQVMRFRAARDDQGDLLAFRRTIDLPEIPNGLATVADAAPLELSVPFDRPRLVEDVRHGTASAEPVTELRFVLEADDLALFRIR